MSSTISIGLSAFGKKSLARNLFIPFRDVTRGLKWMSDF